MASNNTTTPTSVAPPSQIGVRPTPAIPGHQIAQVMPGVPPLPTTSITGDIVPFTYDLKKGKGNN